MMAPLRTTPASRPAGWVRAMFFSLSKEIQKAFDKKVSFINF